MEDLSTNYGENEGYYTSSYKNNDKLGRIWRGGWGKKMAVIGVAVTSAPIILPSFFALSILGLTFSVPVGFAILTYASTKKLVSTLLPMPSDEFENKEFGEDNGRTEIGIDADKYHEQGLNSSAVPDIMEGIREAEDELFSMKNEVPVDSLKAVVVAANLGGEDEGNVGEVSEEMFVSAPSREAPRESDESGKAVPVTGSKSEAKSSKKKKSKGTSK